MADIQQIVASYNRCGSLSQVARELHISRNTVKRYLRRVEEVRCGIRDEILPEDRKILQPRRSVTDEILFCHEKPGLSVPGQPFSGSGS